MDYVSGRGNLVVTVDDETMTWTAIPQGKKIDKPMTMAFSKGGFPGSGRPFTIMPDGTAR
jgi:hypothetical protein